MTRPVEPREVGPLAQPPLRLALVQARTSPVLALERSETVERLVDALDGWELTETQTNVELAVHISPSGLDQQRGRPETVWVLTGPSQQFRAVVSPSSVAVECERYSHWPDFDEALREVLGAVAQVAPPHRCIRFGMRYVNEFRDEASLDGKDPNLLTEFLAEELVAVHLSLGRPVAGSLAELRVREDFGLLAVRHGLVEPGRYLLDMDAYNEESNAFDVDRLMDLAGRFHARIESVFAWALAPDYLASLYASSDVEDTAPDGINTEPQDGQT